MTLCQCDACSFLLPPQLSDKKKNTVRRVVLEEEKPTIGRSYSKPVSCSKDQQEQKDKTATKKKSGVVESPHWRKWCAGLEAESNQRNTAESIVTSELT